MTDQDLEAIGESVGLGPNLSKEFGRALLSKAIPEGYVVVPKKATSGQVEYTMRLMGMRQKDEDHILSIYLFMLDSAPGANWRAAAPSVEGEE